MRVKLNITPVQYVLSLAADVIPSLTSNKKYLSRGFKVFCVLWKSSVHRQLRQIKQPEYFFVTNRLKCTSGHLISNMFLSHLIS